MSPAKLDDAGDHDGQSVFRIGMWDHSPGRQSCGEGPHGQGPGWACTGLRWLEEWRPSGPAGQEEHGQAMQRRPGWQRLVERLPVCPVGPARLRTAACDGDRAPLLSSGRRAARRAPFRGHRFYLKERLAAKPWLLRLEHSPDSLEMSEAVTQETPDSVRRQA